MAVDKQQNRLKILVFATEACAYPGADHVGQIHAEYLTDAYIIRVLAPVVFPEDFYLRCFERGVDAIIVMSCGHECPYQGAYERMTERISRVHALMKERGLEPERLRMCAICTVCSKAFLKEVNTMNEQLAHLATRKVGRAGELRDDEQETNNG